MKKKVNIFNIANFMTLLRIVFSILVIFMVLYDKVYFAVLFFFIAIITDKLDGYFARKFKLVSKFGAIFDTIADSFLFYGVVFAFWGQMYLVTKVMILSIPLLVAIIIGIHLTKKPFYLPHRFSSRFLEMFIILAILLFIVNFKYANEMFILTFCVGLFYMFPDYIYKFYFTKS